MDYTRLLGGIERDAAGRVVAAKATLAAWVGAVDEARGGLGEEGGAGLELDLADKATLSWETSAIDQLVGIGQDVQDFDPDDGGALQVFVNFGRRWIICLV
jgi:hypothetical protein